MSKVDYFKVIQLTSLGELKVSVFDINHFQCEQHKAVYKCFKIGLSCNANTATKLKTIIVAHEVMCSLLSRYIKVVATAAPAKSTVTPDAYRYMQEFILLIIKLVFKVQK